MPDLELRCLQCQNTFVFSEKDQETFYRQNLPQPQRCEKCRPKRRKPTATASGTMEKPRFEIVCDRCGKTDHVSFAPKSGRAVLCSYCHGASRVRTRLA